MYEVGLSCGHKRFFSVKRLVPKKGAIIVCQKHENPYAAEVITVYKGWTIKCETPKCTFFREGMSDRGYATELGKNHLDAFPDHAVALFIAGSKMSESWKIVTPREHRYKQGVIPY